MTRSTDLHALVEEYGRLQRLENMTASVRGQRFNGLIARTLAAWGVSARESVRSAGEIDVAFAVDGVRYVLEAKWEKNKSDTGHLAKLQKRVRQRLAGTYGVFLSMAGYSAEALRDLADGDRLEVLLIERDHFEAMLSGLVPPSELFTLLRDHASYFGRPHTTLADLISDHRQSLPGVRPSSVVERDALLRRAAPGVSATAAIVVDDVPPLGLTCERDGSLFMTTGRGIASVTPASGAVAWAAPVSGCHGNAAPGNDGAIYFARQAGIAMYRSGAITILGAGLGDNSTLFTHPSGDVWALFRDDQSPSTPYAVKIGQRSPISGCIPFRLAHLSTQHGCHTARWLQPARTVFVWHLEERGR